MDLGDLQDQSMGVVCLSELVSRFPSIGPQGQGKREMSFTDMTKGFAPAEDSNPGTEPERRSGALRTAGGRASLTIRPANSCGGKFKAINPRGSGGQRPPALPT